MSNCIDLFKEMEDKLRGSFAISWSISQGSNTEIVFTSCIPNPYYIQHKYRFSVDPNTYYITDGDYAGFLIQYPEQYALVYKFFEKMQYLLEKKKRPTSFSLKDILKGHSTLAGLKKEKEMEKTDEKKYVIDRISEIWRNEKEKLHKHFGNRPMKTSLSDFDNNEFREIMDEHTEFISTLILNNLYNNQNVSTGDIILKTPYCINKRKEAKEENKRIDKQITAIEHILTKEFMTVMDDLKLDNTTPTQAIEYAKELDYSDYLNYAE